MTQDSIDEIDVITNIRVGKTEQFEYIITRHQNDIVKLVSALLLSREETETLTRHIFLKCFENLHKYNLKTPFDTWLHKIATNEVLAYIKQAKDIPFHLLQYFSELEQHLTFEDFFDSYREKVEEIEQYTSEQPQAIKKILQFRYQKNYHVNKIAELMDKKPSEIEKILYLTRKRLEKNIYQDEVSIS